VADDSHPRHIPPKSRAKRANSKKEIIMNCPVIGLRVSSLIFGLMGLVHLIRIILGVGLQVGSCLIRQRWSAVAVIVFAALCVWLWMLASKAAKSKVETPAPAKPAT